MNKYRLAALPDPMPCYNIAPGQLITAVREDFSAQRELVSLKWGLVPSWAKEVMISYKMINARSETVHEKPSFKNALRSRRCIIPASGFYEWRREGKEKIPHYIHFKNGEIMSLAGIWESWKGQDGAGLESCSILTTAANAAIRKIHKRMPVILHDGEDSTWLSRDNVEIEKLRGLFQPYPADKIAMHQVSRAVNKADQDKPELISPE